MASFWVLLPLICDQKYQQYTSSVSSKKQIQGNSISAISLIRWIGTIARSCTFHFHSAHQVRPLPGFIVFGLDLIFCKKHFRSDKICGSITQVKYPQITKIATTHCYVGNI